MKSSERLSSYFSSNVSLFRPTGLSGEGFLCFNDTFSIENVTDGELLFQPKPFETYLIGVSQNGTLVLQDTLSSLYAESKMIVLISDGRKIHHSK
jgi:hypothetical protein